MTGESRLGRVHGGFEYTRETLSGAFYSDKTYSLSFQGATGESGNLVFDASRSSSIYGSSTTVTPLSQSTLYVIKF